MITPESIPIILVTVDDLRPNKKDFTFEVSEKEHTHQQRLGYLTRVFLKSAKTGCTKLFKHYRTDTDTTNEDVYGWHYRAEDGTELLIIND